MTSQGCCPVLVEGLPTGNQTVPAGGNSTFSGIPANTQVTLTAQTDGNCTFLNWSVDDIPSSLENPRTITMDSDYEVTATCSSTPTPTPTPSGYTLTVTSQGCCPILVRNLPGGDRTVLAGGNITFTGIAPGTLARITAQPGAGCKLDHWMIDGVQKPADLTMYLTINSDRTAIAVCVVFTPVTLTVNYGSCPTYYCPIIVSYDGGGGTVQPGTTIPFTGIVPGTLVTLSLQEGNCDGSPYYWRLDGGQQQTIGYPWNIQVTMNTTHTVEVLCGQYLEG